MTLNLKNAIFDEETGSIIMTFDNDETCILATEELRMFSLVYKDMALAHARKCMSGEWKPGKDLGNV